MTMSMYSSYSPEDFHQEEDIFGKFYFNFVLAHCLQFIIYQQLIHCSSLVGQLVRLV